MKKLLIFFMIYISFFLFSQDAIFVDRLSQKDVTSYEDMITLFGFLSGDATSDDFDYNLQIFKKKIKFFPKNYTKEKDLTIGDFSLFAIQYLKIESGVFYLATRSPRYASRELISKKIIPFNTSEFDRISGIQLIGYLQKVVEYEESAKK